MAASRAQPSPDGQRHIPALDGLRGIAILLVVVHHFAFYGGFAASEGIDGLFAALAGAGWSGVDLFFVLSGFLITRILLTAERQPHYFRDFYVRRALRIFPIYYLALAFFFFVWPEIGFALRDEVPEQAWYWTYLVNVRVAAQGWPEPNYLAHFWSLAVEEQFYVVWPLLVFHLRREHLLRLCLILIAFSLALRIHLALDGEMLAAYVLAPSRLDALATGALLALLAGDAAGLHRWRNWAWACSTAAAATLAFVAIRKRGLWTEDFVTITAGLTLLAILSGAVILLAVTSPASSRLARALSSRPLTALGRYSYGLYVLHHPIAVCLAGFLKVDDLPVVFGSRAPALVLYVGIGGSLTTAVAAVSWHVFERHFLNLKERFRGRSPRQKVPGRQPAPAAPAR